MTLILSGPFLVTGEAALLGVRGAAGSISNIQRALSAKTGWAWEEIAGADGVSGMTFSVAGYSNEEWLPTEIMRARNGRLASDVADLIQPHAPNWVVVGAEVKILDIGAGVITVRVHLPPECFDDGQIDYRTVERVSIRTAAVISELTLEVTRCWKGSPVHSSLRWMHRVYVVELPTIPPAEELSSLKRVLPHFHQEFLFPDFGVLPGIDSSVILLSEERREAPEWILRVFDFQHALSAVLIELDRQLFNEVVQLRSTSASESRRELVSVGERIESLHAQVQLVNARTETVLTNLGAASLSIWKALEEVQCQGQVVAAIRDKMAILRDAHQSRVAEAAARRSERLNRTVLLFTLFGVISSLAAVVDFATGKQVLGPDGGRILLLAAITGICGALLMTALRES